MGATGDFDQVDAAEELRRLEHDLTTLLDKGILPVNDSDRLRVVGQALKEVRRNLVGELHDRGLIG